MRSDSLQLARLARLDDAPLVVLATLGSIPAFDILVQRYRGAIVLVARQIVGDRAAAEDIAQEVFLKAFRALPHLDDPERFAGWLRAIARRQALRVVAGERRRQTVPLDTLDALDAFVVARSDALSSDPAGDVEQRGAREIIVRALGDLPAAYQEVLFLYAYEDWSVPRIADFLSVPDATIRGRLFRARRALRRCVSTS